MKCPTLCSSTLSECIQTIVSGVFQAWLAPGLTINLYTSMLGSTQTLGMCADGLVVL